MLIEMIGNEVSIRVIGESALKASLEIPRAERWSWLWDMSDDTTGSWIHPMPDLVVIDDDEGWSDFETVIKEM